MQDHVRRNDAGWVQSPVLSIILSYGQLRIRFDAGYNMNRQQIINATSCPVCKSKAGERCTKKGRHRKTVHALRVQYATGGRKLTNFELNQTRNKRSSSRKGTSGHLDGKDFYSSRKWREVRYKVISKHGRKCMCCGWTPDHKEDQGPIHVDHIEPRSLRPDLQLNFDNLQILCADCNIGKSNKDNTDFRPPDIMDPEPEDNWMDAAFSATLQ